MRVLYIADVFRMPFRLNKARTRKGFSDTPKPTLSGLKGDPSKLWERGAWW